MTIEIEGYRAIVCEESGEVEMSPLKRGATYADYITDDRQVANLLLLAVAERLELLLTLLRQEQEARR